MIERAAILLALAASLAAARRGDHYRLPAYVLGAPDGDAGVDANGRSTGAQHVSHSGVDVLGRAMAIDAVVSAFPHTVSLDAAANVTSVDCARGLTTLTIGVEDVGAALADWSPSTLLIVGAGWGCHPRAARDGGVPPPPAPFLPIDGLTIVFAVTAVMRVEYGAHHSRFPGALASASASLHSGIDGASYTAFETLTLNVSRAPGEPNAVADAAAAAESALAAFALAANDGNSSDVGDAEGPPPAWTHGVSPLAHAHATRAWRARAHARRAQSFNFNAFGGGCIGNPFTFLGCAYGFDATGAATLMQFNTGPAQASLCPDGNFSTCTRAASHELPLAGGLGAFGDLTCVDCFASATLGFELSLHMQGLGVQSFSASATFSAAASAALQLQIGPSAVATVNFNVPLLPSVPFAPLTFAIAFLPIVIDLSGDISLALTLTSGPIATIATPSLWASASFGAGVAFAAATGWTAATPASLQVGTAGAFNMTSDFTTTATARAELVFGLDASLYGVLPVRATAGPFLELAVSPAAAACGAGGAGGAVGADLSAGALWSFEVDQLTLNIFGFRPTLPGLPLVLPNAVIFQTPSLASWCLTQAAVFRVQSTFANSGGAMITMPTGPFSAITLYTLAPHAFVVAAAFTSVNAGATWFGTYVSSWISAGVSAQHLTCQDGGDIIAYNYTLMTEAVSVDFPANRMVPYPATCSPAPQLGVTMSAGGSITVPNCFAGGAAIPYAATFRVTLSNIYETCPGCCFQNSGHVTNAISLIISVNGVDVATTTFSQTYISVVVHSVLCTSSACNVRVRDNGSVNNCGGCCFVSILMNFDVAVSITAEPPSPFASVGGFVCTEAGGGAYAVPPSYGLAAGPRVYAVVAAPSSSSTPSSTLSSTPSPSVASPSPTVSVSPSLSSLPTPPRAGVLNSGISAVRAPVRFLMLRSAFGANSSAGAGSPLAIAEVNVSYAGLGNIVPHATMLLSSTLDATHGAGMATDGSTATYASTAGDSANFLYADFGADYVGITSVAFVAYYAAPAPNVDGASLTLYAADGSEALAWVVPFGTDAAATPIASAGSTHWLTTVVVPMPAASPSFSSSPTRSGSHTRTPSHPPSHSRSGSRPATRTQTSSHTKVSVSASHAVSKSRKAKRA